MPPPPIDSIEKKTRASAHTKETTIAGMLKTQLSFYRTAQQRAVKGDHFERLLFKPVVARIIDRTQMLYMLICC